MKIRESGVTRYSTACSDIKASSASCYAFSSSGQKQHQTQLRNGGSRWRLTESTRIAIEVASWYPRNCTTASVVGTWLAPSHARARSRDKSSHIFTMVWLADRNERQRLIPPSCPLTRSPSHTLFAPWRVVRVTDRFGFTDVRSAIGIDADVYERKSKKLAQTSQCR